MIKQDTLRSKIEPNMKGLEKMSELGNSILVGVMTMMGVVLGWVLNRIDKRGKINIFVGDRYCGCTLPVGTATMCELGESGSATFYAEFVLDIANSSAESCVMRDFKVRGYGRLKKFVEVGAEIYSGACAGMDIAHKRMDLISISVGAKQSYLCTLIFHVDAVKMTKTRALYLVYKDTNNKVKKARILKYSNIKGICTECA